MYFCLTTLYACIEVSDMLNRIFVTLFDKEQVSPLFFLKKILISPYFITFFLVSFWKDSLIPFKFPSFSPFFGGINILYENY